MTTRTTDQNSAIRRARAMAEQAAQRLDELMARPEIDGQKLIDELDSCGALLNDAAALVENVEVET
jgi:hypothetical protein